MSAAFWPGAEAGAARVTSFVRYLPAADLVPVVVSVPGTSLPRDVDPRATIHHAPYRDPRPGGVPFTGKTLPLWRRLARDVIAVPDRYKRWSRRAAALAWSLARKHDAPVLVSVPPLSAALHLARLRRPTDPPLFIDFRDGWLVDPVRADYYRNPLRAWVEARMERRTLEAAHVIFAATPRLAETFRERAPHLADRSHVLLNGVDDLDWRNLPPPPKLPSDALNIVYAGSFPGYRTPEHIFDALAGVKDIDVRLHILGDDTGKARRLIAERFPELRERVAVHDRIARPLCLSWQLAADLLLLVITPGPRGDECDGEMTSKCFEYLRAGRRILATVPPGGDADRLLEAHPWVERLAPDDVAGIRRAIYEAWEKRDRQPSIEEVRQALEPLRRERQVMRMARTIQESLACRREPSSRCRTPRALGL